MNRIAFELVRIANDILSTDFELSSNDIAQLKKYLQYRDLANSKDVLEYKAKIRLRDFGSNDTPREVYDREIKVMEKNNSNVKRFLNTSSPLPEKFKQHPEYVNLQKKYRRKRDRNSQKKFIDGIVALIKKFV